MTVGADLLLGLAVLAGALTQRTTGLGFGLVGGPLMVAAAGPVIGVSVSNALSILLCAVVLARTWRDTQWRSVLLLAVPAVAVIPLGAVVVHSAPEGPLLILVGSMAVIAILISAFAGDWAPLRGVRGAVIAGALSGFMSVTGGVGGPMVSAYALVEKWSRTVLIPTAQAYLLIVNIASLASKGVPTVSVLGWGCCLAAMAIGVLIGDRIDGRIGPALGRRIVIGAAIAGGLGTVIRGIVTLL